MWISINSFSLGIVVAPEREGWCLSLKTASPHSLHHLLLELELILYETSPHVFLPLLHFQALHSSYLPFIHLSWPSIFQSMFILSHVNRYLGYLCFLVIMHALLNNLI